MEQEKISKYPSKKFLIRGAIAASIVATILIVQTPWFLNLFKKKEEARKEALSNATVGELVGKDSNNNGIADWEERLWGLDPTKLTTNGVANKTIIEQKRKQLGGTDDTPLNENDRLARDLFMVASAVGQEGVATTGTLSDVGKKIANNSVSLSILPRYGAGDIKTVKTTAQSLIAYRDGLEKITSKYNQSLPEIELLITALDTGDYSQLTALNQTIVFYRSLSEQLRALPVPIGVAQQHLLLINSISGISGALQKVQKMETDSVTALTGFSEYRFYEKQLGDSVDVIISYLEEYDIL